MLQAVGSATCILAAGRRQNVHLRAIEQLLLQAEAALALGKLFIGYLAVEGDHARRKFLKLLGQDNAALGKILARQLFDAPGGTFHQVGQSNAEFNDAAVIRIVKWLRDDATVKQDGPEQVAAPGIVVARAHGRLAGVAAYDDELHPFSEIIWKCFHSSLARSETSDINRTQEFTSL